MNKTLLRIFNKCNEVIRDVQCTGGGGSRKYEYEMRKQDVVARY